MSDIWLTSDLHLDHGNVLNHMPLRGETFENITDMEDCFIDTTNELVKTGDRLIISGDFCWRAGRIGHFRSRLNVRELYIARGNHDAGSIGNHVSMAKNMLFLKMLDRWFHIQHYPCLSWRKMQKGGIHCYGHSHGLFEERLDDLWPYRNSMDIGIDNALQLTGRYRPFHIDEVIARCSNPPERSDHP